LVAGGGKTGRGVRERGGGGGEIIKRCIRGNNSARVGGEGGMEGEPSCRLDRSIGLWGGRGESGVRSRGKRGKISWGLCRQGGVGGLGGV